MNIITCEIKAKAMFPKVAVPHLWKAYTWTPPVGINQKVVWNPLSDGLLKINSILIGSIYTLSDELFRFT